MKILVACEYSGTVRDAFRALGHDAWSADLMRSERGGPHWQCPVETLFDQGWDMMIAFPPCTYLCISANAWTDHVDHPNRRIYREEAQEFFMELANAPIPRIAIENPIGVMSTHYRPPDQIIHPYDYGHAAAKSTCLWLKNLPLLEATKYVPRSEGRKSIRDYSPRYDRGLERARTFQGIANAMADQWGKITPDQKFGIWAHLS